MHITQYWYTDAAEISLKMDSNVANCNKYMCLETGICSSFWVECNFSSNKSEDYYSHE